MSMSYTSILKNLQIYFRTNDLLTWLLLGVPMSMCIARTTSTRRDVLLDHPFTNQTISGPRIAVLFLRSAREALTTMSASKLTSPFTVSPSAVYKLTRQVTRATHLRNRVCPQVELILKIIIIYC